MTVSEVVQINSEIQELEEKLKALRMAKRGASVKQRFKHTCPHCGETWWGTKEEIKECLYCKRMMKQVSVDTFKKCTKFDAYLKVKKRVVKEIKGQDKRYIFEWLEPEGLIAYNKVDKGVTSEVVKVHSTYEIMRSWDLSTFFREFGL